MSLPALEDITSHRLAEAGSTEPIEGLIRIETTSKEQATPIIMEGMRSVYPHDQVFGESGNDRVTSRNTSVTVAAREWVGFRLAWA